MKQPTGKPVATVIVPTTADRGPLLRYSVGSALRQTVRELEVFIVGDGCDDSTRAAARELEAFDPRVRFLDYPKSPRRAELERHRLLGNASGDIVCYLTDRDLWRPHHVETMREILITRDFAAVMAIDPGAFSSIDREDFPPRLILPRDPQIRVDRDRYLARRGGLPLSCGAHTLAFYHQLPEGWRTTPAGTATDQYMWAQFMAHPACSAELRLTPTVLYFKRGDHPGWPTEKRALELEHWSRLLEDDASLDAAFRVASMPAIMLALEGQRYRSYWARFKGRTLPDFLRFIASAASRRALKRARRLFTGPTY